MSSKSIVQRSIRIVDWSIERTVDGKDDNSASVSTGDAWIQCMISKHIVGGFDHHEFLFEGREAGAREAQKDVPEALEKSGNRLVAASLNRGICVAFAV